MIRINEIAALDLNSTNFVYNTTWNQSANGNIEFISQLIKLYGLPAIDVTFKVYTTNLEYLKADVKRYKSRLNKIAKLSGYKVYDEINTDSAIYKTLLIKN